MSPTLNFGFKPPAAFVMKRCVTPEKVNQLFIYKIAKLFNVNSNDYYNRKLYCAYNILLIYDFIIVNILHAGYLNK